MAVAQQQSCSHCDSTSGQKRTRPSSRWPKSSLQEPGRRETISSLALITSVTRQEGLQTTGISSSTSAYRTTDVEEKGVHCVQLSPGCSPQLQSSVSSSEYSQPGWGIPPHIPFTDTLPHGGRQPVLTSTPLPGAIPMQKMALPEALWNFLLTSLHHPLACTTCLLQLQTLLLVSEVMKAPSWTQVNTLFPLMNLNMPKKSAFGSFSYNEEDPSKLTFCPELGKHLLD